MIEKQMCMLLPEERDARGREAMDLLHQIDVEEDRKRELTRELSEKLKELRTKLRATSKAARTGLEERDVEVFDKPNSDRLVVETFRQDTGELVRYRPMTEDEIRTARQQALPLRESPAIPQAATPLRGEASVTPIRGAK